jgi:hypothetical protein
MDGFFCPEPRTIRCVVLNVKRSQLVWDDLGTIDFIIVGTIKSSRQRWLSGTILASLVLDSTGLWVRISARTPILRNITTGGDITGGFSPGACFPSCHKSIYRVSEDNFRGSACVSE